MSRTGRLFTLDPARVYPVLTRSEGIYVWDDAGNRYLDAIAGIAAVNVGYGRHEVAHAMATQAAALPFAVPNIFASEPAIRLANAIAELLPGDLSWVHFTSGGSEAVEAAIKLARQYHVERGHPDKCRIIGRWTSYHGASLGALSATGSRLRRQKYQPLLIDFPHIPPAYCYRCPWQLEHPGCDVACATALERELLAVGPETVAAFIAEPIVASVGGAIAPVPEYFPMIREICDRYDILMIADEVVTGFGRTGVPFAMQHWNVVPDLLVMGKGVSGGYAALGAVGARDRIREVFASTGASFDHIFTYSGHPIAMAAGLAVLDIWRRERLVENVAALAPHFQARLERLRAYPFVGDIRVTGFMAGIELVQSQATKEPFGADRRIGRAIQELALREGVVVYPGSGMADGRIGDVISLYPPLVCTGAELDELVDRLGRAFARLLPGGD